MSRDSKTIDAKHQRDNFSMKSCIFYIFFFSTHQKATMGKEQELHSSSLTKRWDTATKLKQFNEQPGTVNQYVLSCTPITSLYLTHLSYNTWTTTLVMNRLCWLEASRVTPYSSGGVKGRRVSLRTSGQPGTNALPEQTLLQWTLLSSLLW